MKYRTSKGKQLADYLLSEGISNQRVLDIMANTPRELFVPEALRHKAYENNALPIGQGQTISQPLTVANMTEQLLSQANHLNHIDKVLEIGTGSGYQTAILAQCFTQVFSVERIKTLQFQAKRRLNQLNLHNIKMKHGDGWEGWASKGPFDAIIVTAAAETVPQALVEQLSANGFLILPVGTTSQKLISISKNGEQMEQLEIGSAKFVPLISGSLA